MLVQEKMAILKATVDAWQDMSDLRCEITLVLRESLQRVQTMKVDLPEGVASSDEDDLVNSILVYHDTLSSLNDLVKLDLAKLLIDVDQLADKIDPNLVYDF